MRALQALAALAIWSASIGGTENSFVRSHFANIDRGGISGKSSNAKGLGFTKGITETGLMMLFRAGGSVIHTTYRDDCRGLASRQDGCKIGLADMRAVPLRPRDFIGENSASTEADPTSSSNVVARFIWKVAYIEWERNYFPDDLDGYGKSWQVAGIFESPNERNDEIRFFTLDSTFDLNGRIDPRPLFDLHFIELSVYNDNIPNGRSRNDGGEDYRQPFRNREFFGRLAQPLGETFGGFIAFVSAQLMLLTGIYGRFWRERLFWFGGCFALAGVGVWLIGHAAFLFIS